VCLATPTHEKQADSLTTHKHTQNSKTREGDENEPKAKDANIHREDGQEADTHNDGQKEERKKTKADTAKPPAKRDKYWCVEGDVDGLLQRVT
jgi:hypothetical protein